MSSDPFLCVFLAKFLVSYNTAYVPTERIEYTFAQQGPNTMLLVPSSDPRTSQALYHISVTMNCLVPLAHLTTVRHGPDDDGPVVGEFE